MFVTRTGANFKSHTTPKGSRRKTVEKNQLTTWAGGCRADEIYVDLVAAKPPHSSGAYDFKWEYQCNELLSKLPRAGFPAEVRIKNAVDKMLISEVSCKSINENGYNYQGFGYTAEWFNTVLTKAANICSGILGDFSYDIFQYSRFTGGASTSRKRRFGDPYFKYSSSHPVHCTPGAAKYAYALRDLTPLWKTVGSTITVVPGNRITTVPKKTDIDRCIAMEPDVNMALQLAVGRHIRKQLRKAGIDLNDQTHNQKLAKYGSSTGLLSTIDLSAASDSIATRLVRDLLPQAWCTCMEDLRSTTGTLPNGDVLEWEKFSSMGNGYTFELESLIFYAVSKAAIDTEHSERSFNGNPTARSHLSVYGDDIICPTVYASNVIMALHGCGFTTNVEKTFITGPFRESCGKHYYNGVDVTPMYIKKPIDTVIRGIWFLNTLRRWSSDEDGQICDPSTWTLWKKIKKVIPRRLFGGYDLTSVSSVASPGKSKDRLLSNTKSLPIDGPGAILRSFQFANQDVDTSCYMPWYKSFTGTPFDLVSWVTINESIILNLDEQARDVIITPAPSSYRFVRNEDLWTDIPLYSQEIN